MWWWIACRFWVVLGLTAWGAWVVLGLTACGGTDPTVVPTIPLGDSSSPVETPPPPVDSATTEPVALPPMIGDALAARCPVPNPGEVLHPGSSMARVTLAGAGRCNDGSSPVMYIRAATDPEHANDWVWFFDGGGFCSTYEECAVRWCGDVFPYGQRHMSSGPLPQGIGGDGITSLQSANTLNGWNMVFAAYCTSDSWGGTRSDVVFDGDPAYRVHFEGALVAEDGVNAGVAGLVSDDLSVALPSLADAAQVVVAGTSAGCSGAARHTATVAAAAPGAQLTTVLDSCFHAAPEALPAPFQKARDDQLQHFYEDIFTAVWGIAPDPNCAAAHPDTLWRCIDMDASIRESLGRVVLHHDQSDPVVYGFYSVLGMSKSEFAQAAIDTYRLYEATEPDISIHSNNCGVHTSIDADGTFLRFTVVDAVHPEPPVSIHDVVVASLSGGRTVAVDSSPPTTSACEP